MDPIRPSTDIQEILCADQMGEPCGLVIFGASGDLTNRKLLPSLFSLFERDLLSKNFYILGCGRKELSNEDFQKNTSEAISKKDSNSEKVRAFTEKCYYCQGDYSSDKLYADLKQNLDKLDETYSLNGERIFYLSLPPFLYPAVADGLGKAGLSKSQCEKKFCRIAIEKPFGRDLQSAIELNDVISKWFSEEQIYRIDHYLGKETVQNILMFRFTNSIFEPIWNRNYIDHVQITIAESLGIEDRGSYYDKSGAIRDMFQNHMLSMLSLVAMEPPISFEAEHVRDEKAHILESIRPFNFEPWTETIVRGQYQNGLVDGKEVIGYRQEKQVDPKSNTDTFVAAKVFIDNWRWESVPFYLRTGKRLAKKVTEIAIVFKNVPHSMFKSAGIEEFPPNTLVMKIQPHEGISLQFQAKRPGAKLCIGTLNMDFNYEDVFKIQIHDAYERLLLDCMNADQTLFTRIDDAKLAWKLVGAGIEYFEKNNSEPCYYPAGAESFAAADEVIGRDGREWRKISEI